MATTLHFDSEDPTIATVSSHGLVTALAAGTTKVHLRWFDDGAIDTAVAVTVTADPVAALTVAPKTVDSIHAGDSVQLAATLTDGSGNALPRRARTWSSVDATIATVKANQRVTAVKPGTTQIVVAAEGHTDTATMTVVPRSVATVEVTPSPVALFPGDTVRLTATLKAANSEILTGRPIVWATSDTTVATGTRPGS